MSKRRGIFLLFAAALVLAGHMKAEASALQTSPYVSFSPDHRAWTTHAGDTAWEWYPYDTSVKTGIGGLRQAEAGEHYYTYLRSGVVPIREWKVKWETGACIHDTYREEIEGWHNLNIGKTICGNRFYSGWNGYCADCGELAIEHFTYMSKNAAMSLYSVDTRLAYYYLCPWCNNMEMGTDVSPHQCKGVSGNRYKVHYEGNASGGVLGNMPDSLHMYNDLNVYEGKAVSYSNKLSKNQYEREGYLFLGWNTKPDGTGDAFGDEEIIRNLSAADCTLDPVAGTVTLYAQWKSVKELIYTEKLGIQERENVYFSAAEDVYYVRGDGLSPFTICYMAGIDAPEGIKYKVQQAALECGYGNGATKYTMLCKDNLIGNGSIKANEMEGSVSGNACFAESGGVNAWREGTRLGIQKTFTMKRENSGQKIEVIPRAGVTIKSVAYYSDLGKDRTNGIVVVGDGDPPEIKGTGALTNLHLIDRDNMHFVTDVYAVDLLSGVKNIQIQIKNADNGLVGNYTPDAAGHVRIDITRADPLFTGDFTILITAWDNVGNSITESYGTTEFALTASVERILSPHEPVFEAGESGILHISTWGYADRVTVEFAEEFLEKNPDLSQEFCYRTPAYRQDEDLQFMIPLYMDENREYEITVRAYKGHRKLEEHPRIRVIKITGTVLDDFRTRLK